MSFDAVDSPLTTNVVGYFNAKKYPQNLMIAALGLNCMLPGTTDPKTKGYLLDRLGRKINDPRLEEFVKPDLLSREVSPTQVPIIGLAAPVVAQGTVGVAEDRGLHSVKASRPPATGVPTVRQKEIRPTTPSLEVQRETAANANALRAPSLRAFTMAEAKKAGLFSGTGKVPPAPQLAGTTVKAKPPVMAPAPVVEVPTPVVPEKPATVETAGPLVKKTFRGNQHTLKKAAGVPPVIEPVVTAPLTDEPQV